MTSTNVTIRIDPDILHRIETAANDCALSRAEWIRSVLVSGLELHESPPVPDPEYGVSGPVSGPGSGWEDYESRVSEEAVREREAEARRRRTLRQDMIPEESVERRPGRVRPEDCIHPPSRRQGARCGACGMSLNLGFSIGSAVNRFGGTRRV